MKRILLLIVLGVMQWGCKRNSINPPSDNEIHIGSPSVLITRGSLATDFVTSSKIGIYSVANKAVTFNDAIQGNVGYSYDANNTQWLVVSGVEPLKWQFSGTLPLLAEVPLDLVAYYPYVKDVVLDVDNVSIPFSLVANQLSSEDVQKNDLLWARSTGLKDDNVTYEELAPEWTEITGKGVKKSSDAGKKVNLKFYHTLTSINFQIAFKQIVEGNETYSDVKVKKIEVFGPNVTTSGKLNLNTGLYTVTANEADVNGSIMWAPVAGDEVVVETIHDKTVLAADAAYLSVCTVVVQPQDFKSLTGNMFKFTVAYKHDLDGADGPLASEDVTKEYSYTLGREILGGVDVFAVATNIKAKTYMELSSNEIRISTQIVPWTTVENIIEAE